MGQGISATYPGGCGGAAIRSEIGDATALRATDWLCLGAAPTFAIMALLTGVFGGQTAQGALTGDLSTIAEARIVADQANNLGRFDAVIHNAVIGYCETRRVENGARSSSHLRR